MRTFQSHGDGSFQLKDFSSLGENIIWEDEIKVWHPETISLGNNVYVGHRTLLKGHPKGTLNIGSNTWIGQECFFHSAGNITIGEQVGIGPRVMMLTSTHQDLGKNHILLDAPLDFKPIVVEDHVDIGIGAILLPGVTLGKGAQIGAGSVVTKDVPPFSVVAGNPARVLRHRT